MPDWRTLPGMGSGVRLVSSLAVVVSATAFAAPPKENVMKVQLEVVETKRTDEGWRVLVALTFTNEGKRAFELDKVSVCHGGKLRNDVFEVTGDAEVPYQGPMVKRAHPGPGGFLRVAPGASVRIEVALDEYRFPDAGGTFTAHFETQNHFSKDDVRLKSGPVTFTLDPKVR